ncbi:MAG: SecD/SecF family protein translocase subunit [Oscillospiraceae bacterium]|nr:SecD/SecF family protein translocase subunit [Oscillospiraceae bacterium]
MKRIGKPVFFFISILILLFSFLSIFGFKTLYGDRENIYVKGVGDIRFGIDIRGGVDVTFIPDEETEDITDEHIAAAESIIKVRLISQNITDYEVYTDNQRKRIIVRFPWKANEEDFNPEEAISELSATAELTFRESDERDDSGEPIGVTKDNIILTGADIENSTPNISTENQKPVVSLTLNEKGKEKFSEATKKLSENSGKISIWLDNNIISAPTVNAHISDGKAIIEGSFTPEEAKSLSDKINSGSLPFKLKADNFSTISPTLGTKARDIMGLSGMIAFILICIFMIIIYRLPGFVSSISLLGQVGGTLAAISGFFIIFPSFTLTLPGIAGIILGIGIGVDANIITSERITEEINSGKTIDGAISSGFKRGFTAVFDGNITVIIVAIILMGSFGPPNSFLSKIFEPIFFLFGPSTAGSIYSFGYTLLISVILNFIFGLTASKFMLKSISKFKLFRNPKLYGGKI